MFDSWNFGQRLSGSACMVRKKGGESLQRGWGIGLRIRPGGPEAGRIGLNLASKRCLVVANWLLVMKKGLANFC